MVTKEEFCELGVVCTFVENIFAGNYKAVHAPRYINFEFFR